MIVTGAASEIGRATARMRAAAGAGVAAVDIDRDGLEERMAILEGRWLVGPLLGSDAYMISNAGIVSMTRGFARAFGPHGVPCGHAFVASACHRRRLRRHIPPLLPDQPRVAVPKRLRLA